MAIDDDRREIGDEAKQEKPEKNAYCTTPGDGTWRRASYIYESSNVLNECVDPASGRTTD